MTEQGMSGLLLHCLSYGPGGLDSSRLADLSRLEWDELIDLSRQHQVTLILRRRLQESELEETLPRDVRERLRRTYLWNLAQNLRFQRQTAAIRAELQSRHIPVVLLKGAHLAQVVYDDVGLRPMVDIDLLVRREDLGAAADVLRGLGYSSGTSRAVEQARPAAHHTLPTFSKPGAGHVDLHWNLLPAQAPFAVDIRGVWERVRPLAPDGGVALAISPEDLLLHLSLHIGYAHSFGFGILGLCDIAEVVRHYRAELDWPALQHRSRAWGAAKCVYLTLRLARDMLGADIPSHAIDDLQPEALPTDLVAQAREAIFRSGGVRGVPFSPGLARIMGAARWQDKLMAFLRLSFPRREVVGGLYGVSPSSLRVYLFYPLHLRRVLRRRGRAAWRLLRGDQATVASFEQRRRGISLADWLSEP